MNDGKQKHASRARAYAVLHARCEDEDLTRNERILTLVDIEYDVALEQVNGNWPFRAVRRHAAARGEGNQGQAQRPVLDQRSRAPACAGEQTRIDHLLIALQMADEDVPFDGAIQRRHELTLTGGFERQYDAAIG